MDKETTSSLYSLICAWPVSIDMEVEQQYNLAVRCYLHRNFNRSYHLVEPLVGNQGELKTLSRNLQSKIIKLYFTLVSMLLTEIRNYKILNLSTHTVTLHFKEYFNEAGDIIISNFHDGILFNLINELNFDNDIDILLMCLIIEYNNSIDTHKLHSQVETVLHKLENDSHVSASNLEKLHEFYIFKLIYENYGSEKAKEVIKERFQQDPKWMNKLKEMDEKGMKEGNEWGLEAEPDHDDDDDAIYDYEEDYDIDVDDDDDETITVDEGEDTAVEGRTMSTRLRTYNSLTSASVVPPTDPQEKEDLVDSKRKKSKKNKKKTNKYKRDRRRSSLSIEIIKPFAYVSELSSDISKGVIAKLSGLLGTENEMILSIIVISFILLLSIFKSPRLKANALLIYTKLKKTLELATRVR